MLIEIRNLFLGFLVFGLLAAILLAIFMCVIGIVWFFGMVMYGIIKPAKKRLPGNPSPAGTNSLEPGQEGETT